MVTRAYGSAFGQFLDNLSAGDPVAVALAAGFALLIAIAAGIGYYDRAQRRKAAGKKGGAARRP